jgi:S-adenosylmethionine:tRNA ribosyltransferase-isomerase
MKTEDLHYDLPQELIAQQPAARRDASRLLVLDRQARSWTATAFTAIGDWLRPGDRLVLNDTRVIRARLHGAKATGGKVEIFLLHERASGEWEALVRPSAKVKPGTPVHLPAGVVAVVGETLPGGRRSVTFDTPDVLGTLERIGEIPLPPYIHRDHAEPSDLTRYQTVYAAHPGAVAAPTAGLHFTEDLLADLEARGIGRSFLTLHVGYGTFRPIQADTLEAHRVEPEEFEFSEASAAELNQTRAEGGRIVAVGTTSTRVLETQHCDGAFRPGSGSTDTYIYPPHEFSGVDAMVTNFHLPQSSLLALVCAFAGTEFVLDAYRYAVQERFRFYSYGDAMLIV